MDGLAEPPSGSDSFEWDLRRARVAIFTGDIDDGVGLLETLLVEEGQEWDSRRTDRLLQVVFDLQTVQQHRQALTLFGSLLDKQLELQQRRELLFWMADSLQALEQYDQAAYLCCKRFSKFYKVFSCSQLQKPCNIPEKVVLQDTPQNFTLYVLP